MAEYIEREAAAERLEKLMHLQAQTARAIIEAIPAADVRPVVRGKWISHDFVDMEKGRYTGSVECSVCHRFLPVKENFCPNCGAMMEES